MELRSCGSGPAGGAAGVAGAAVPLVAVAVAGAAVGTAASAAAADDGPDSAVPELSAWTDADFPVAGREAVAAGSVGVGSGPAQNLPY